MNYRGNWNYPTAIRFGENRVNELPECCAELAITNPLIVTDPGLAKLDVIKNILKIYKKAGIKTKLFSDLKSNPIGKNVADGVQAYKAGKHDGVVAIGGGSALDTGKAIAFMVGQKRPIWDFEDVGDNYKRASNNGIAPIIAVPTTAGTGSEVGRAVVILDEAKQTKKIIFHPQMLPSIVIEDPQLTVGLPAKLTAATGMDALAHNFEAYCSPGFHPLADGIAVEGLRLIKENLITAVNNGQDLEARAAMLAASSMGATAFQKGLGAIHALSHPIGALYDAHHGLLNGIFLPYVLAFNHEALREKMVRLARYINIHEFSYAGILHWLLDLRQAIGIPHTLREIGIDESRVDEIAAMAELDPSAAGNPIPVSKKELKEILLHALDGNLETPA